MLSLFRLRFDVSFRRLLINANFVDVTINAIFVHVTINAIFVDFAIYAIKIYAIRDDAVLHSVASVVAGSSKLLISQTFQRIQARFEIGEKYF